MKNPLQLAEKKNLEMITKVKKKIPEDSEYPVMTTAFKLTVEDNVI